MTRREAAQLKRNEEAARAEFKALRAKINGGREKKQAELTAECLLWCEKITGWNIRRGLQA